MKLSLNWLSDFVDLTVQDPAEIERRVTTGVAEVDAVEIQGALLRDCCVGQVLSLKKHPNADRLTLCDVKTDKGVKKVVCGGTNLREGMRVAFAHTGATVRWHGTEMVTLEKTKIRGEESEGMICAAEELDLVSRFPQASDKSIIDLGDGTKDIGTSLKEYLGLSDVILHIDNHAITHRPDLFSHVGFAREFVALGLAKWKKKPSAKKLSFGKSTLPFKVSNDIPDLIPRYCSCLITIDGVGETPQWMKERLEATGWRSINLPIDITNYVMMETGMPLHSFDADDIKNAFTMRASKKGESLTTLDEEFRQLPDGAVVISDDDGIFDLLGIMGGLRSSTKPTTKTIYLHAAIVDPVAIRRAVLATGHRTDAATVYEKGVPRITAMQGLTRAVELFLELIPGAKIASKLEEWGDDGKQTPIQLPLEKVTSMLGVEISEKDIVKILEDLEFDVTTKKASPSNKRTNEQTNKRLTVVPPLHRRDIRGPHDLIEEIGRVAGYNEIPVAMPQTTMAMPHRLHQVHQLRDALKAQTYVEILPISLVSPALLQKCDLDPARAVRIRNPLGEETSVLHTSTFPSLLEHAERNILQSPTILRTFHWGHIFEQNQPERPEMSILAAGMTAESDSSLMQDPFLLLKRDLTSALAALGMTLAVDTGGAPPPYAHPGRFAQLSVSDRSNADKDDKSPVRPIGMLFEVHPEIRTRFGLPHRAAVATLDLSFLLSSSLPARVIRATPQFPAVSYDVSLPLTSKQQAGPLLASLRGNHEWLENVEVVDLYSAKQAEAGSYTVTMRFTYRAPDRTLTETEVKPVHEKILKNL